MKRTRPAPHYDPRVVSRVQAWLFREQQTKQRHREELAWLPSCYLHVSQSFVPLPYWSVHQLRRNELFAKISVSFPKAINHPDPEYRKKDDPFHTAFNLQFNTEVSFFGADGWLTKDPEEPVKFGLA